MKIKERTLNKLKDNLLKGGYCKKVHIDEVHGYLVSGRKSKLFSIKLTDKEKEMIIVLQKKNDYCFTKICQTL